MPYAELVGRVADLVPLLRDRPDLLTTTLAGAGVFRLRVPRRYGGYECDTSTLVGVAAELGRAGGAAAWTACAYWAPTWLATRFGDRARDEVFASSDVRVCGTPGLTAAASPVDGGVVVDGRWSPVAGALDAHWQVAFTVVVPPGGEPYPVVVLLPLADLTVEGVTTCASGLFVPAHRVVPLSTVASAPVAPVWAASSVGAVVGTALDAGDWFFDGLATDYGLPFAGGSAMAHTQTRDALSMIADAERVAHRLASLVDSGVSGADSVRVRADLTEVCRLAEDAVYLLATVHGSPPIRDLTHVLAKSTTQLLTDVDAATTLTGWHHAPRR